jgi:hypothetical protein
MATADRLEIASDLFQLPGLQDLQPGPASKMMTTPRLRRFETIISGAAWAPVTAGAFWRASLQIQ